MNKLISILTALCLLVSVTGADIAYGLPLSGSNPENAGNPASFIPFNLGKVIESKTFENSRYTVINIQDLHCHIEAQRNIEQIIDRLQKNYKISAIFIEGGYDEVDPGIFGRVKDEKLRNNIIEGLFEKGRLTGAEYYYLKNDVKTPFYGLEDRSVHQANLDRLSKALANNKKYNEKLSEIKAEIEYLKAKYFSRENQRFTETFENYKNGGMPVERYYALLRKYIEKLNKNDAKYNSLLSMSRDKYPVFREYCELMNAGKRIDYNKAAVEMQSLVSYLKDNLSYNEYNKLSLATAGFSNIEELGLRLPALSRKYGVNINPGSGLGQLVSYIQASAKINPVAMLDEERRIAEDIRMAFCSSEEEVEISFLSDFYIYLESFLNTKITAADYDFFEKEYPRFEKIYSKYAFKNTLSELKEDIDFLIRYYGVNKDRNSIFLKNIEKRLSKNDQINDLFIVITGGFHSEGLNKIFAENAISYISVMPSVTRETKTAEENYNTFLAAGSNLFAAQTLALTLASQTHKAEIARMMISVAAEELSGLAYNKENIFFIIESVAEALGENIDVDFSLEQTVLTMPGGFKIMLKNADGKIANETEVKEEILNDNTVRLAASERLELGLFEAIESLDHVILGVFNPRVSDIAANISAFAAKRNLITGDGLIFDIETNRDLPEKLGKYDLDTLRKMPDRLQRAVLKAYERDENINNEERIQARVFLAAFSALGLDKAVLDAAYADDALKRLPENADESETFILENLNGFAVERFDLPYFKEDVTYIADALLEGKIAAFTIEEHPGEDLDDYFERAHKNINFFAIKMIKELFNKNNVSSETFFDESGAIEAVYEILKNAYVHGNKTRGERRIYIAFDKTSNRIIIVNGVFEESSEDKERISQAKGALHGKRLGKQIAVSKGDYKAEILSAPNGQEFYFAHFTANPLEMNEDYSKAFGVDAGLFKKLLVDLRNTDEELFRKVLGVLAYIVTDNMRYMFGSNSFDESEIDEFFQKHDGFFKRITYERVERNASFNKTEETDGIKRLVIALRDAASTRNGELNEELPSILEGLGYDTQNGKLELDFSKRIADALRLKGGFFKEILRGVLVGIIEFVPSAFLLPFFPLPFVLMHYSDGNGLVTLISGYDGQRDESFHSRMRGAKIINYGTWSLALSAAMAVSFFGLPAIWAALVPVVYNVFAHAFYNISHSGAKLQIGSANNTDEDAVEKALSAGAKSSEFNASDKIFNELGFAESEIEILREGGKKSAALLAEKRAETVRNMPEVNDGGAEASDSQQKLSLLDRYIADTVSPNDLRRIYDRRERAYLDILKNCADAAYLRSVVNDGKRGVEQKLFAVMFLKAAGFEGDFSALEEQFIAKLKKNSFKVRNSFDLMSMLAGSQLLLEKKEPFFKNAANAEIENGNYSNVYEKMAKAFYKHKKPFRYSANSNFVFNTADISDTTHELAHIALHCHLDKIGLSSSGLQLITMDEFFAFAAQELYAELINRDRKFNKRYSAHIGCEIDYTVWEKELYQFPHLNAHFFMRRINDFHKRMGIPVDWSIVLHTIVEYFEKYKQEEFDDPQWKRFFTMYGNKLSGAVGFPQYIDARLELGYSARIAGALRLKGGFFKEILRGVLVGIIEFVPSAFLLPFFPLPFVLMHYSDGNGLVTVISGYDGQRDESFHSRMRGAKIINYGTWSLALSAAMAVSFFGLPAIWAALVPVVYNVFAHAFYNISHSGAKLQIGSGSGRQLSLFDYENDSAGKKEDVSGKEYAEDETEEAFIVFVEEGVRFDGTHYYFATYSDDRIDEIDEAEYNDYISRTERAAQQAEIKSAAARAQAAEAERAENLKKEWKEARKKVMRAAYKTVSLPINGTIEIPLPNGEKIVFRKFFRGGFGDNSGVCCVEKISSSGKTVRTAEELFYRGKYDIKGEKGFDGKNFAAKAMRLAFEDGAKLELPDTAAQAGKLGPGKIKRAFFVARKEFASSLLAGFVDMHYGKEGPTEEEKSSKEYKLRTKGAFFIKAASFAGFAFAVAVPALLFSAPLAVPLAALLAPALTYASNISAHAAYNIAQPEAKLENQSASNSEYIESVLLEKFNLRECLNFDFGYLMPGAIGEVVERVDDEIADKIKKGEPALIAVKGTESSGRGLYDRLFGIIAVQEQIVRSLLFKIAGYSYDRDEAFREIFRNALIHGNSADPSKKIWIYYDGENNFEVINEDGSGEAWSLELSAEISESKYFGRGSGSLRAKKEFNAKFAKANIGDAGIFIVDNIIDAEKKSSSDKILSAIDANAEWQDFGEITAADKVYRLPEISEGMKVFFSGWRGSDESFPLVFITKKDGKFQIANISGGFVNLENERFGIREENGFYYLVTEHILEADYSLDMPDDGYNKVISLKTFDPSLKNEPLFERVETDGEENPETAQKRFLEFLYSQDGSRYLYIDDKESGDKYDAYFENVKRLDASLGGNINGIAVKNRFLFKGKNIAEVEYPGGERFLFYRQISSDNSKEQGRWYPLIGISGQRGFKNRYVKFWFIERSAEKSRREPGGLSVEEFYQSETLNNTSQFLSGNIIPYEIIMPKAEKGSKKLTLPALRPVSSFLELLGISGRTRETALAVIELPLAALAAYSPVFNETFIKWHRSKTAEQVRARQRGMAKIRAAMDDAWEASAQKVAGNFPVIKHIRRPAFAIAGMLSANIKAHVEYNLANSSAKRDLKKSLIGAPVAQEESALRRSDAKLELDSTKKIIDKLRLTGKKRAVFAAVYEYFKTLRSPESFVNMHYPFVSEKIKNTREYKDRLKGARQIAAATIAGFVLGTAVAFGMYGLGIPLAYAVVAAVLPQFIFNISVHARHNLKNPAAKLMIPGESGAERSGISRADLFDMHKKLKIWDNQDIIRYLTEADQPDISAINDLFEKETSRFMTEDGQPSGYKHILAAYKRQLEDNRDRKFAESFYSEDENGGESSGYQQLKRRLDASDSGIGIENRDGTYYIIFAENRGEVPLDTVVDIVFNSDRQAHRTQEEAQETKDGEYLNYDFKKVLFLNDQQRIQALEWVIISLDASMREKSLLLPAERRVEVFKDFIAADRKNCTEEEKKEIEWQSRIEHVLHYISKGLITENAEGRYCESPIRFFSSEKYRQRDLLLEIDKLIRNDPDAVLFIKGYINVEPGKVRPSFDMTKAVDIDIVLSGFKISDALEDVIVRKTSSSEGDTDSKYICVGVSDGGLAVYVYETSGQIVNAFYIGKDAVPEKAAADKKTVKKPRIKGIIPAVDKEKEQTAVLQFLFVSEMEKCKRKIELYIRNGENEKIDAVIYEMHQTVLNSTFKKAFSNKEFLVLLRYYRNFVSEIESGRQTNAVDEAVEIALESASLYFGGPALEKNQKYAQTLLGEEAGSSVTAEDIKEEIYKKSLEKMIRKIKRTLDSEFQNGGEKVKMAVEYAVQHIVDEDTLERLSSGERGDLNFKKEFVSVIVSALNVEPAGMQEDAFVSVVTDIADLQKKILEKIKKIDNINKKTFKETAKEIKADIREARKYDLKSVMHHIERLAAVRIAEEMEIRGYKLRNKLKDIINVEHINIVAYETSLLPAVTTVDVAPVTLTLAETRKEIEKRGYSGLKAYLYTGYAELIKLLFMPAKNFAALHDNFNTFEYEKRVLRTRIVKTVVFALSAAAACFVFLIMPPAAGLLPFIANSVVALFSAAFSLAFFGISVHAAHNFFENLAFKAEPMAFSLLSNKEMDGKLDDYLHSSDINLGDDVNFITDVEKRKEIGLLFKKPQLFKNGHETRLKVLKLIEAYFLKAIENNDIKAQDALVDMVYGIYDNALDSMVLEEGLMFGFEKNGNTDIERKKYELLEHFYKINAAFFKNVLDDQMITYRVNNQKRIMRLFLSAGKKARMQEIDKEFASGLQDSLYINANLEILSSIPREYILRRLTQQQRRDLESALQSAGNVKYLLDDLSLFAIPKHISWMYIKTYRDKAVLKRIVSGDFAVENKLHALLSLCAAEPNPFGAEAVFSKIAGAKEEKIKISGDTENKLAGESAKLVKKFSENGFYSEKDDYARSLEAEMLFTAQALILHEKYPQIDLAEFLRQLKFTFVRNGKIGFIIERAGADEAEYYDVAISNKAGAAVKEINNIVEDVYKNKVKSVSKGPMSLIKTVPKKTVSTMFMLFITLAVVLPFISAEAYSATVAAVYPHVEHLDSIVNTVIPVIPAENTLESGVQMGSGIMESLADKLLRAATPLVGFFALMLMFFSSYVADFINKHKRKTIKADKVNINYAFTQNRITEKDLEPFKASSPREEISVRLYVTNKMPFQKEKFDFKNTGVKINGKSVWISFAAKAPVIFAEDARLEDIEEALKNDNKKIRKALAEYIKRTDGVSLKRNLSLDWINVNAGTEKSSLFYDENGRVRVNISREQARRPDGVSDYMTGVRQVRDADIFAAVQNIYYFLDNVKTARELDAVLSDFQKIGNGQIVLDYDVLKNNLTDSKIKDFFAAARANGVKIIADLRAKDASAQYGVYRDAGFDGVLYESGAGKLYVYDFILASERSASVVSNYENSRQLARELSKSNDIKILNNSEITAKIASDDRSMIDRIRILKILKGSALLGVLKKDRYTPDFVRNAAYAFSQESMSAFEKIDPDEFARLMREGDTDAVKKYLNLPDSHAATIYLEKNIYDNIEDKNEAAKAQTAFLEGILEKILISKAVAGSIVNKDLEKMLGKALRMQAQSAKKAQSPVDADSFKEEIRRQTAQQTASMKSRAAGAVFSRRLQSALSEKVKSLAEDAFAENDAVALAGIIELIPAIAEVRLDVDIDKDNLARFDVKQLRSLLTAA